MLAPSGGRDARGLRGGPAIEPAGQEVDGPSVDPGVVGAGPGNLLLGLPGTAVWAVGLFLGISLITSGMALLFSALDARNNAPSRGA